MEKSISREATLLSFIPQFRIARLAARRYRGPAIARRNLLEKVLSVCVLSVFFTFPLRSLPMEEKIISPSRPDVSTIEIISALRLSNQIYRETR